MDFYYFTILNSITVNCDRPNQSEKYLIAQKINGEVLWQYLARQLYH